MKKSAAIILMIVSFLVTVFFITIALELSAMGAEKMNYGFGAPQSEVKKITFTKTTMTPVIEFLQNGDILLRGKKIGNDKEVFDVMKKQAICN